VFETLLIANRGEIACRIIRSAHRLGLRTVAVYSEADRDALHVRAADIALPIGPPPARESYLSIENILAAAKRSGAEAVHPGYGFLSENADFAEACDAAGLVFVGPPAAAIRAMGRKDAAKASMRAAGVPVVPGSEGEVEDLDQLRSVAEQLGFPVLLKAVAGGGGRGMRRVDSAAGLEAAFEAARREARSAFGDPRMLLEKYVTRPRHVELQVFADGHGNVVHLFERDCSLQRRHQKVIEEAPAPGVRPALRQAMGEAAVRAACAIDYRGAGTVEFILDVSQGVEDAPFYFMEMNTRLQVEHPVTEMVTGLDLVEWQLRVAAGERLPWAPESIALRGHAIEARVYAEDPARGYLPQTGRLLLWHPPQADAHVRVDSGVCQGDAIGVHYDPLLAKLVVWDVDREHALRRLRRALEGFELAGLVSNLELLAAVAGHPAFARAELDTGFLERHAAELLPPAQDPASELVALAVARVLAQRSAASADCLSPWAATDCFRLAEPGRDRLRFGHAGGELEVEVRYERADAWRLEWSGYSVELSDARVAGERVEACVDGRLLGATIADDGTSIHVLQAGRRLVLRRLIGLAGLDEDAALGGSLRAPMPGRVIAVLVAEGERVSKGQVLLRLEAMKMEHSMRAAIAGVVTRLAAREGEQVEEGAVLLVVSDEA